MTLMCTPRFHLVVNLGPTLAVAGQPAGAEIRGVEGGQPRLFDFDDGGVATAWSRCRFVLPLIRFRTLYHIR